MKKLTKKELSGIEYMGEAPDGYDYIAYANKGYSFLHYHGEGVVGMASEDSMKELTDVLSGAILYHENGDTASNTATNVETGEVFNFDDGGNIKKRF